MTEMVNVKCKGQCAGYLLITLNNWLHATHPLQLRCVKVTYGILLMRPGPPMYSWNGERMGISGQFFKCTTNRQALVSSLPQPTSSDILTD